MSSIGLKNRPASPSPDTHQEHTPSASKDSPKDSRQQGKGTSQGQREKEKLADSIDVHSERLDYRHAAQQAEILTSTRVARQAPNPESYPVFKEGPVALSDQNITILGTGEHGTGGLSTDRTGFMAKGSLGTADHNVSGMGGLVAGNTYGEVAVRTSATETFAVGALNGPGVHGMGLTATQHLGTQALNEGFFVVGDAAQTVTVTQEREADDKVLVKFSDKKWAGLQATFGASSGAAGVGLRAYLTQNRDYEAQRWLPRKEASAALADQSFWKNKLRSLGIMPQAFVRPDLNNPRDNLEVGDLVSFTKQTTMTGGVAAAMGGIYVGLHASVAVEQHTIVKKQSDDVVRVTVSPKPNRAIVGGLSLDVPLLAAATVSMSQSVGRLFTFDFNLAVPEAVNAYHDVLKGKMPTSILQLDPSLVAGSPETLLRLSQEEHATPGVSVVAMVYGARKKDLAMTAGLTALPNILGDKVGMMGYKMRAGQTRWVAASADKMLLRSEAAREGSWGFVRRGSDTITAKLVEDIEQQLSGEAITSSNTVSLEASFKRDRPTGSTREDMLKWLNANFLERQRVFSEELKPMTDRFSYGLTVTRSLVDDDLKKLWLRGAVADVPAAEADFRTTPGTPLASNQRRKIIEAIKSNIVRHGVSEFTKLQRVLGDDGNLEIKVTHDGVKTIEAKHLTNSVKFAEPIVADTPIKEVVKRIATADKHSKRLKVAEREIRDDLLAHSLDNSSTQKAIEDIQALRQEIPAYARFDALNANEILNMKNKLPKKTLKSFQRLVSEKPKRPNKV